MSPCLLVRVPSGICLDIHEEIWPPISSFLASVTPAHLHHLVTGSIFLQNLQGQEKGPLWIALYCTQDAYYWISKIISLLCFENKKADLDSCENYSFYWIRQQQWCQPKLPNCRNWHWHEMKFGALRNCLPRKYCGVDSEPSQGSNLALVRSSTWVNRQGWLCRGSSEARVQVYRRVQFGRKEERQRELSQGGQMHPGKSSYTRCNTYILRIVSWCVLHRLK